MEKQNRMAAQVYGYAVCLVAVITFLISTTSLVNALIDLGDPLHAGFNPAGAPSLASFEIYKMDMLKSSPQGTDKGQNTFVPDDTTLRAMYEAAKSDKIQRETHRAHQAIIIGSLLILISAILFITHWRWMQKIAKT